MKSRILAGLGALAVTAAVAGFALPASAKTTVFMLHLTGKQETPPNDSKGTGMGKVTYDDKTHDLSWNISFKGLTGDAVAAHFHGPAKPGESAGVTVPVGAPKQVLISPIIGSATLTDDQAKELLAGKWYFNVHTAANPKGEIRAQLVPGKAMMRKMEKPAESSDSMGGMKDMGGMKTDEGKAAAPAPAPAPAAAPAPAPAMAPAAPAPSK